MNPEEIAASLDHLVVLPEDVLWRIVTTDGACMDVFPEQFTGEPESDRELAALTCAGCPVRAECLELEFRTAGLPGFGVWGALNEEDRRAVYPQWLARRGGAP